MDTLEERATRLEAAIEWAVSHSHNVSHDVKKSCVQYLNNERELALEEAAKLMEDSDHFGNTRDPRRIRALGGAKATQGKGGG